MKKASTLIAIIIGLLVIFGAFLWEGGEFGTLFLLPPMLIVFGGTLAAGLAGTSFSQVARMPKLFMIAISPKKYDMKAIMDQIIQFAQIARRDGILVLEDKLKHVKHPYLKKLIEICIDGASPDTLEDITLTDMEYITERHEANISFFNKLGGYSPTMGIIGTVMGLISTLASAGEDPNVLIHHIASAFIATMWGILMANIVWLPIGDKLKTLHDQEMLLIRFMLDGVKSLQTGENPTVIKSRLISAFPTSKQEKLMGGKKAAFNSMQESPEVMPPPEPVNNKIREEVKIK